MRSRWKPPTSRSGQRWHQAVVSAQESLELFTNRYEGGASSDTAPGPDDLWSYLGAIRLPDWEPEACPCGEWLEGILRRQFLVDVNANPRRLVDVHISLLHLRAAGKDLLNYLPPTEIHSLLNAEIRYRHIHMALACMLDRVDVSRAVPGGSHTECLSQTA